MTAPLHESGEREEGEANPLLLLTSAAASYWRENNSEMKASPQKPERPPSGSTGDSGPPQYHSSDGPSGSSSKIPSSHNVPHKSPGEEEGRKEEMRAVSTEPVPHINNEENRDKGDENPVTSTKGSACDEGGRDEECRHPCSEERHDGSSPPCYPPSTAPSRYDRSPEAKDGVGDRGLGEDRRLSYKERSYWHLPHPHYPPYYPPTRHEKDEDGARGDEARGEMARRRTYYEEFGYWPPPPPYPPPYMAPYHAYPLPPHFYDPYYARRGEESRKRSADKDHSSEQPSIAKRAKAEKSIQEKETIEEESWVDDQAKEMTEETSKTMKDSEVKKQEGSKQNFISPSSSLEESDARKTKNINRSTEASEKRSTESPEDEHTRNPSSKSHPIDEPRLPSHDPWFHREPYHYGHPSHYYYPPYYPPPYAGYALPPPHYAHYRDGPSPPPPGWAEENDPHGVTSPPLPPAYDHPDPKQSPRIYDAPGAARHNNDETMPVTTPEARAAADNLPKEPEGASAYTIATVDPEETAPTSKAFVPVPERQESASRTTEKEVVPSANRAVVLQDMALTARATDSSHDVQSLELVDFDMLVNFPDYLVKSYPGHFRKNLEESGKKHCVMCGNLCICLASAAAKDTPSSRVRAGNKVKCLLGEDNDQSVAVIPRQNRGLCTNCDVLVWVLVDQDLEIKWCKGCKNFRPWAAFGTKGKATKCVPCRERQREKYASLRGGGAKSGDKPEFSKKYEAQESSPGAAAASKTKGDSSEEVLGKTQAAIIAKKRREAPRKNNPGPGWNIVTRVNDPAPVGDAPSANRCMPLREPFFSSSIRKENSNSDDSVPDFDLLMNFPDYSIRNYSARSGKKGSNAVVSDLQANDPQLRHCVMCGRLRLCLASAAKDAPSRRIRASMKTICEGALADIAAETVELESKYIIPRQNKGLCTACDVTVWNIVESDVDIKWCKGCKNFRPWAAFGESRMATKCCGCRDRQREKYASQKDKLRTKRQNKKVTDRTEQLHAIEAAKGLQDLMAASTEDAEESNSLIEI